MIFMVTKDEFLYQGVAHLFNNENVIRIERVPDIERQMTDSTAKMIIDVYHNHVIDDNAVKIIQSLNIDRIVVLAPFHISKIKCRSPLFFINRKMPLANWPALLASGGTSYRKPKIGFSHNQFKIVSYILHEEDNDGIASALNISGNTLRSQKFNIMLKLKLRRMSDIATLSISPYF
ncbi:TPA: LuxR family transcriptional regulator [Kluyvera ascorbata]|uniref:LuxR family transcriptional regulator n=1 Tax=Kluyvera genomosp. 2 TaxID=2774054 RepID=A0A2T2XZE1_9ENTR|nr:MULTISPECIES: LuxR C-terminal-related transcriptional regulator [Enterobacteriaceae]HAT3919359.1 LuxR family transcriptional regulator [Kluyvera ascorbata]PSR45617.1 LuxR family transcriptional regulator [Kluyvera genomosp. 2]BBQ84524.1 LuxR family transcriptional regulator [Klebsiella sp. WP3-W18-ESBL-02]BBR21576.1 LuxR family transcriptional regulator [Klebsiella sp. WP3-S18-ESBL-05]HAT3944808.1 LuxR family transcriptional regulator [Kluyvera ascorbata]